MYTYQCPSGRPWHTDGSFTGDVLITLRGDEVIDDGVLLRLPWEDVLAIVAEKIRDARTGLLEQASAEQLLGLPGEPV